MKKTTLKTLIDYLIKERKLVLLFLVVRLAMTGIDIYSPLLIKNLIDKALPSKNISLLLNFSLLLVFIYILRFIFAVNSQANGKLLGSKIRQSMRNNLVKKILNQPVIFFRNHRDGELISRVMSDLESVSNLYHRGLEDFIFSVVTILVSMMIMFSFNFKLSLIALCPLPFTLWFVYRQNRKMKSGHKAIRKNSGILSATFHDILKTIYFLKDNSLEEISERKFRDKNQILQESEKRNIVPSSLIVSGVTFYSNITQLVIILAGGYLYIKNMVTMGVILSFILLVDRFRLRIMRMVGLVDIYQKGMAGVRRYNEIINLDERDEGEIELKERVETIKFTDVSFGYNGKNIVQNIDFELRRGEKIAFVGENGIGKTTITSLLKKALLPTAGDIYINNELLNNITYKSYLAKVGVVDQNEYIINGNIIDNITIIRDEFSEGELKEAFDNSYLHELLEKFEERERCVIGDGGVHISSGQKQKIAMARLFLKNPDIILLDEATNAMDIINEKSILNNIKRVFSDRIIIAITHRLSILKDFDRIYLVGDEGIVEQGSFDELIEREGRFYELYNGVKRRDKN